MAAKRSMLAVVIFAFGCALNEAAVVDGDTSQYELEHRRHEESLAGLANNMTIEAAVQLLENLTAPPQLLGLVQRTLGHHHGKGSHHARLRQPAHAAEVATATDKLNEMIYEVQSKYELEHQKCCEYDRTKRLLIEETAQDIALFNAEAARGRSGILSAQTQLQIGNSRVPKLQESLQQNTEKCNGEVSALEQQLAVVLNDIPVLASILEMTDCSNPMNQEQPADSEKKVQQLLAEAGSKVSRGVRHLVEQHLAEHRMALLAEHVQGSQNASEAAPVMGKNTTGVRRLHLIHQHQAQQPQPPQPQPTLPPLAAPSGGPCTLPSAADKAKVKCAAGPGSCGKLQERFLAIQVSIVDKRDHLKDEIKRVTDTCKAANEALNNQIAGYNSNIMAAQTSLARWTKVQNDADEQNRLKTVEKSKMEVEFKEMTQTCQSNYLGFESQECGLRKIRGELAKLKNNSLTPYFQDCQLSAWAPDACTASCGGGRQTLKRSIVTPPKSGVKCLPLEQIQSCNTHTCPQDCKMADWAAWSGCTAECGGGIQQREREILVKARFGGKPCGDASETRSCNIQSCNEDCQLNEWSEWSGCSKACGSGRQRRMRSVKEPPRGTGKCAGDREESRLEFRSCNNNKCPAYLTCRSVLDVVLVLDGAAGIDDASWNTTRAAMAQLVTGFVGTGVGMVPTANVAVLAFGGPDNWAGIAGCTGEGPAGQDVDPDKVCRLRWVTHFTGDIRVLKPKLENLRRPQGSRLTSAALGMAEAELTIGRKDVPSVVLVVTNGRPLSYQKTKYITQQLRKKARVTFVAVTDAAPVNFIRNVVSEPDNENVMLVQDFNQLGSQDTIDHIISSLCPAVGQATVPFPTNEWDFRGCTGDVKDTYSSRLARRTGATCRPNGVYLNGKEQFITYDGFPLGGSFTMEMYVKAEALNTWSRVLDFGDGPFDNDILLTNQGTSDTGHFEVNSPQGPKRPLVTGNFWRPNVWQHVVVSFAGGVVKLYRDGQLAGQQGDVKEPPVKVRKDYWTGRSHYVADAYWQGTLAYLRVWQGTAISDDGVRALHEQLYSCNGLAADYFYLNKGNCRLANLNTQQPGLSRVDAQVNFNPGVAYPYTVPGLRQNEHFEVRWTGSLLIKTPGIYQLKLITDDGARLSVNGDVITEFNDCTAARAITGQRFLAAGYNRVEIQYFQSGGGLTISFLYSGPDTANREVVVPQAALCNSVSA